ncbi:MAG: L,D-transpeptidase family protein [Ferruginibacter sp.]
MIKILTTASLFFALFISCRSNSKSENDISNGSGNEKQKKITKRDHGITAANAFNDVFFDSMTVVKFNAENSLPDSISRRITSFYNARNYQFAWFDKEGLTEQARGFWNMHNYQTTYGNDTLLKDDALKVQMDRYAAEDSMNVSSTDSKVILTELKLTQHFITYNLNSIGKGYIKRKEMERFIPIKKMDALLLADSLVTKKHKDNKYYEDVNISFKLLKDQLAKYISLSKQGGLPVISVAAKKIKKGAADPGIIPLKKYLWLTADMQPDTTDIFNDVLEGGIKNFQLRFGYKPTGVLTDRLIADMNVPLLDRIKQILLNMGRMQWLINEPIGQLILVNIPEFILHVKEGKTKVFDMTVVVGKEGHNTMMFTGDLSQVVFSPYWNVPVSIVTKEILPEMNKRPDYLASHNMEIVGSSGGIPVIRQLPGGDNSLGKIKFLFPNSYNIYFHDTPAKSLFQRDKRAFSHGCIRLSDPAKMANYLLQDRAEWSPEKIDSAMNGDKEQYVKLKKPVPVLITYYTAWVDDNGLLHFADDIYGHDKKAIEKMFVKS